METYTGPNRRGIPESCCPTHGTLLLPKDDYTCKICRYKGGPNITVIRSKMESDTREGTPQVGRSTIPNEFYLG